uniref:Aminoacyl tRNA synthetase complex interacting multifunctional protein 1 n=1 Tax=Equus caballus TaxID=9796 RepID=A0A9L0SAW2_HORSE
MILCRFMAKMATSDAVLKRLEQKGAEADHIIEYLKQQVALLKEKAVLQATLREEKKLRVENAKLKKEVEELKQELIQAEIRNGAALLVHSSPHRRDNGGFWRQMILPEVMQKVAKPSQDSRLCFNLLKQIPCPSGPSLRAESPVSENVVQSMPITTMSSGAKEQIKGGGGEEKKVKEKMEKKGEKKEKKQQSVTGSADSKPIDVSRLDLRIGCIITAKKHPDADSLYVEEVDVGETAPRTVVSGLVNHVPLEQLQNRMVILLCNLKPARMRGVLSQAMVMCASSPEKVEILAPPDGSVPGDRITFDAFPGEPDKELNPKKKIWEQIQPDLYTNDECVATYKGAPFEILWEQ